MNDYFTPKECRLWLCQCDIDIIKYAFDNIDWGCYCPENFGGENEEAAGIHMWDILDQLSGDED